MSEIKKPLSLILLSAFILVTLLISTARAEVCDVSQIRGSLRKALFEYFEDPNNPLVSLEKIKDLLIFYLTIPEGEVLVDCSGAGSFSGITHVEILDEAEDVIVEIPRCSDNTKYGECSLQRPRYCYAGSLVERCDICGCPSMKVCQKSQGKCTSTTQNIVCYIDSDCGTYSYVGGYFCENDDVKRNYIHHRCVNPGTSNSYCENATRTALIDDCGVDEICEEGTASCLSAPPPTTTATSTTTPTTIINATSTTTPVTTTTISNVTTTTSITACGPGVDENGDPIILYHDNRCTAECGSDPVCVGFNNVNAWGPTYNQFACDENKNWGGSYSYCICDENCKVRFIEDYCGCEFSEDCNRYCLTQCGSDPHCHRSQRNGYTYTCNENNDYDTSGAYYCSCGWDCQITRTPKAPETCGDSCLASELPVCCCTKSGMYYWIQYNCTGYNLAYPSTCAGWTSCNKYCTDRNYASGTLRSDACCCS